MNKRYLLLFVSFLVLSALACNALPSAQQDAAPEVETEPVVDAAVATVQAQLPDDETQPAISSPSTTISVDTDLEAALVTLYERANPAVVFVITGQETIDLGSGSGFLFDSQGHIVTNNHVVADGEAFEVEFPNGVRRRAELAGTDVDSDLAVLKIDDPPAGVEPLPLADFDSLRVGQFVAAIGNPFAEQGSLSFGIISGLGRSIVSQRLAESGGFYSLPEVIQTDAPINPGNSGGPLLNLQGEVVGVNSSIRSTTGVNSGVGFAIPVAAIRRIVPELIENGSYVYPFMGIGSSGGEIDLDRQEALNLPQASGVYVTSVTPNSPADEAGVVAAPSAEAPGGDLIIGIDDREVQEFTDLISYLVFETEVGQTVDLTIIRDGETITVPLTLGERP